MFIKEYITKTTKSCVERIYVQGLQLFQTAFKNIGSKYSYFIDNENKKIIILPEQLEADGIGTISKKKINGEIIPVLDISNKKIAQLFSDCKQCKITILEDEILVEGLLDGLDEQELISAIETLEEHGIQSFDDTFNVLKSDLECLEVAEIVNGYLLPSKDRLNTVRLLSLFSGIGAFEEALKVSQIPYEVVNYCEVVPYIAEAYALMHNEPIEKNLGDITKIDPATLPEFDLMTYGFPCFVKGTKILTLNGYKNIEEITKNDYVLTHNNNYKKVVKPMINYAHSIYNVSTMCSDDIFVTEEHPFYVRKLIKKGRNKSFNPPEWIKTKNLSNEYYVGIAINQKSELPNWDGVDFIWSDGRKSRKSNKIKDYFDRDDFWWVIGRFIGDGWIRKRYNRKNNVSGIIICCAFEETDEIKEKLDGLGIKYCISKERTTNKFHITNGELGMYCMQFGQGAENKTITGDIINLPCELLKGFINGYLSADGCFTNNLYKATSVSSELIYGLGQCIAKAYHRPFSIYKDKRPTVTTIEDREVLQKDTYQLTFRLIPLKKELAFYDEKHLWFPIKQVQQLDYNGNVYNMEVEDDNSYTVNNIIVHNCQDVSGLGNRNGFFDSEGGLTRSGLFLYAMRIAGAKNPLFMIGENVKAFLNKNFKDLLKLSLDLLDGLHYNTYYKVVNTKDYGIPHSRSRVFFISIRKDIDKNTFKFPEKINCEHPAWYYKEECEQDDSLYLEKKHERYYNQKRLDKKYSSLDADTLICMTTKQGSKSNPQNFFTDKKGVRMLNAREMFLFQGFDKSYGDLLLSHGFSLKRIGYMLGNSISVAPLVYMLKQLLNGYMTC